MLAIIRVTLVRHVTSLMWHVLQGSGLAPHQGESSAGWKIAGLIPKAAGQTARLPPQESGQTGPGAHGPGKLPVPGKARLVGAGITTELEAAPGGDSLPAPGTRLPHTALPRGL